MRANVFAHVKKKKKNCTRIVRFGCVSVNNTINFSLPLWD